MKRKVPRNPVRRRKNKRTNGLECSRCPNPRAAGRYCLKCHAAFMREWRKTHPLNDEQRRKDACRSYANIYQRRGHLVPKPCEVCGDPKAEKHHDDYAKPLEVRWLCRKHHLEHHKLNGPGKPAKPAPARLRKRRLYPRQPKQGSAQ